jgi:uncharacterized membrane protein
MTSLILVNRSQETVLEFPLTTSRVSYEYSPDARARARVTSIGLCASDGT